MNNNILVTAPSKNIRETARQYLGGNWKTAFFAVLIFYVILRIPVILYENLFRHDTFYDTSEVLDIAKSYDITQIMSPGSGIYSFVITAVFTFGLAMMFLSLVRGRKIHASDAFDGFEYFLKALGLYFMTSLFIILWSLLFIVPGIIAAIRYSQVYFILSDNPDINIMDCINESKKKMTGNKAKFFCLGLSFIGWAFLAALPEGILMGIVSNFGIYSPFLYDAISFIALIPEIILSVYISTSYAVFYELLSGKTMANIEVDADYVVMDQF